MSTLVAIDGVLYDLESSPDTPDGVAALVGEPEREDEGWGDPEEPDELRADVPS